jgi:hypothetical protein
MLTMFRWIFHIKLFASVSNDDAMTRQELINFRSLILKFIKVSIEFAMALISNVNHIIQKAF